MNATAGRDSRIRNVIEVNPVPGPYWFLSRHLAPHARILQLSELGARFSTSVLECPASVHCAAHLPDRLAFQTGSEGDVAKRLVSGLLSARLLVIHRPPRQERVAELAKLAEPDIVWASDAAAVAAFAATAPREPLLPYCAGFDGRSWRGEPGPFLANSVGSEALDFALVALESRLHRLVERKEAVYDVDDLMFCGGFYPIERGQDYSWAWTGPTANAWFILPALAAGRLRLTLFFIAGKLALNENNIGICINGARASVRHFPHELKIEAETMGVAGGCATVELRQDRTVVADTRRIGFALQRVKVESLA